MTAQEQSKQTTLETARHTADSLKKVMDSYDVLRNNLKKKKSIPLPFASLATAKKEEELNSQYHKARMELLSAERNVEISENEAQPFSPRAEFFQCDSIGGNIKQVTYLSIQNRYYTILELMYSPNKGNFRKADNESFNLAFLLRERDTNNYLLWYFQYPTSLNWPDIYTLLSSYFIKAQNAIVGKDFIATAEIRNCVDINTGEVVEVKKESEWHCSELTLIPLEDKPFFVPFFILENDAHQTIKLQLPDKLISVHRPFPQLLSKTHYLYEQEQKQLQEQQRLEQKELLEKQRFEEKTQFKQECIAKYGQRYGTLICEGKVVLGMNQQMCTLAWGEPNRKNRTIVAGTIHEQWVYGLHHYLYFENGVLTGIQD